MNFKEQHIDELLHACKKQDQKAQMEFQITGSGDITAQDLKAQTGQAQITGSGDIEMHATETLNGSITVSGDLLCYGSPERQVTKVTGSGDITIRD